LLPCQWSLGGMQHPPPFTRMGANETGVAHHLIVGWACCAHSLLITSSVHMKGVNRQQVNCTTSSLGGQRTYCLPLIPARIRPELEDSGNSSGIRFGTGTSQIENSIPAEYPPESCWNLHIPGMQTGMPFLELTRMESEGIGK